jgi:hypothetical protein
LFKSRKIMFLNSYSPKLKKIKKKKSFLIIKYSLVASFILTIITVFILSGKNTDTVSFDDSFYEKRYAKDKSEVRIVSAKLIGSDEKNRPYVITAKSALKNSIKKNIMILYSVEADISLEKGKWMLLQTKEASYDHDKKILSSQDIVKIYYNNGTSLESSNIDYNISSGLIKGNNGITMFGNWGIIESDSFSFNIDNQKLKFFNNPSMKIN